MLLSDSFKMTIPELFVKREQNDFDWWDIFSSKEPLALYSLY